MKVKRRLALILVIVWIVLSLAACGGGQVTDTSANGISVDGGVSAARSVNLDNGTANTEVGLTVTYRTGATEGLNISYTKDGYPATAGIVMTEAGKITVSAVGEYGITAVMKADPEKYVTISVSATANSISVDGGSETDLVLPYTGGSLSGTVTLVVEYAVDAEEGLDFLYTKDGNPATEGITMTEDGEITIPGGAVAVYGITVKMKANPLKFVTINVEVRFVYNADTKQTLNALTRPLRILASGSTTQFSSEVGDYAAHDPSAFKDPLSGKYYIFKTEDTDMLESDDLMNYKAVNSGFFTPAMATEARAWVGGSMPFWAPTMHYMNGLYHFYYSLTASFGSAVSAIGLATAENINGPYTNKGVVVQSVANAGQMIPNCIDPEIFEDKDGKVWMTYGSFGAGIFVFELDKTTGKAKNGPVGMSGTRQNPVDSGNYGTHIGGGMGMEGSEILYNPDTDYYYLFVSIIDRGVAPTSLQPSLYDTYNVRVGRSRNPNGPYTDTEGYLMTELTNGRGSKILGATTFVADSSESQIGIRAPGHNSVLRDDDGSWYMFYHARDNRYAGSGIPAVAHWMTTARMLFNASGWPVVSPNKYRGEELQAIGTPNLEGEWKIVKLIKEDPRSQLSTKAVFNSDRTISGAYTGTYRILPEADNPTRNLIEISLQEDGKTVVYQGVALVNWDYWNRRTVLAFTAMNDKGVHIWGNMKFPA